MMENGGTRGKCLFQTQKGVLMWVISENMATDNYRKGIM